jgi:hypothetical protein
MTLPRRTALVSRPLERATHQRQEETRHRDPACAQLVLPIAPAHADRLKIVALIAAFTAHMGQSIWWHRPWNHALISAGYTFGSFLVAGLVLSYFVTTAKA